MSAHFGRSAPPVGRDELPFLTAELPGTGGVLKYAPDDFRVDEIPLYTPCGEGEHLYLKIRKQGLATLEALRRIAKALNVSEREIGYAGLKDARAVTTQWISARGIALDAADAADVAGIEILEASRHTNKLRTGHLVGNRFTIVVRGVEEEALHKARAVLDVLVRRGTPNYFGEQRFGVRGEGHRCGEAILRRDYEAFVRSLIGGPPGAERDPYLIRARRLFDAGKLEKALQAMPVRRRAEKKCLHALLRFGDPERAYFAVPVRMRQLYASAYQSWLFNKVLARRVQDLDRIQEGDVAYLHRNGAVFQVVDPEAEQPRCQAFEISPSGPMFGSRTMLAESDPGRIEREIFAETGLSPEDFDVGGGLQIRGVRRALRMPLREVSLEACEKAALRIRFALPKGCYATSVMREIMKPGEQRPKLPECG